jgi:hypothetical protein
MQSNRLAAWEHPVLSSVMAVVADAGEVRTDEEAITRVADWLAYEELPLPSGGPAGPFDFGADPDEAIDAVMVKECLDFAFTDFGTRRRFEVEYLGRRWSDSEALLACLHRAWAAGVPVFDGEFLAGATRQRLETLFQGSIELPMLDERAAILGEVGVVLVDRYGGRFHRFVRSCAPAMYAAGEGLLERLVTEFPRFADESPYRGRTVVIHKLAQLALWSLHLKVGGAGGVAIRDLDAMTAFADYVVPVALRLMGIVHYSDDLEARIASGEFIERDSEEEVEIRSHTLYATALLTEAINGRRPATRRIVIPQLDYRLWSAYHTTWWPHHLTRTVMY